MWSGPRVRRQGLTLPSREASVSTCWVIVLHWRNYQGGWWTVGIPSVFLQVLPASLIFYTVFVHKVEIVFKSKHGAKTGLDICQDGGHYQRLRSTIFPRNKFFYSTGWVPCCLFVAMSVFTVTECRCCVNNGYIVYRCCTYEGLANVANAR